MSNVSIAPPHPHRSGTTDTIMKHRRLVYAALAALVLVWAPRTSTVSTTFIAKGASWKYLDNGTNQGTAWRAVAFDDSGWAAGPAQLGYGDGDEATTVSFGGNASAKYATTYFRRSFTVADPSLYQSLTLNLLRDDGAVAYLNGTEVFRTNMPSGAVTSATFASTALGAPEESTFYAASLAPALLVTGTNVLAVEVHQANLTSSDLSFNAELIGSTSLQLTRGPYLQTGTPSSVIVRWRTGGASDSRVLYGLDPNNLLWTASDAAVTTEHQVPLSPLSPNTTYYYAVGSSTVTLAGGDANHSFVTPPLSGASVPTRVWVLGDSGTADANARAVRDAYYAHTGSTPTNLWLMLGDNAYNSGLDSEFQAAVFDMYPAMLRKAVLWPTLGNHDGGAANSSTGTGPYYDNFTLPKQGEAGGLASGTEAYFSFDYGAIHFINLESFETNRAVNGPMLTWLQNDLASTTQKWIVAFFHHPPYSKGSHDSDVDIEMKEMRQNALPILEAGGVDLVLTGHSHSYERSYLIDGHYGLSGTFTSAMKKDGGNGRESGTGAYKKPTDGVAAHEGAVYAVAGSSGKVSAAALNHPAMFVSMSVLGSMVLDVTGSRLDARFIDNTGATRDSFTIVKGSTAPIITTTALPDGVIGTAYGATLAATGGATPYTFSLDTGALPAGLQLNAQTGLISGTPAGPAAQASFVARVTGQGGLYSTKAFSITVGSVAAPGAFGKTAPKNGAKNLPTATALSWASSAGAASYEYCYDTSNDNLCSGAWVNAGSARTASLSGLTKNKAYYWEVRAVNTGGTTPANAGAWWKFTTAR